VIRNHPSVFVLGFIVIGIAAADRLSVSPYFYLLFTAIAFGTALIALAKRHLTLAAGFSALALGLVSAFHFGIAMSGAGVNHLKQAVAEPTLCHVYGQVADWPELRHGRTEIIIALDSLETRSELKPVVRPVKGRLLLKVTDTTTALQRGDRVAFQARIYPVKTGGTSGFDYGRYLNLRGVFAQAYLPSLLNVWIDKRPMVGILPLVDRLRTAIRRSLERNLSPPAAALASGFLIGETRDIPPEIYRMFRDSGTMHLLAVSGSNVALVVLFFMWVLRPFRLGTGLRSAILLIIIAVFAGLSYGDPSVIRASIMASLVIGARMLGRTYDLNNVIAATALLILLVDPAQLFDVGFQLSFVTAWGLIFIMPRLASLFRDYHERTWYRWLVFPFLIALVAQVVSTPIVAYHFDRFPVIGLAANLIIVPMVSLGVVGILLLLAADLVWPLLGAFVGSLLNLWLESVVAVLQRLGGENIPIWHTGRLMSSPFSLPGVLLIYLLIILAAVAVSRRWARKAMLGVVTVAANVIMAVAMAGAFAGADIRLNIEKVPGGAAVLVQADRSTGADLIITRLSRKAYPIDERVLEPMLRRHGVAGLNRLFVLAADYDAVDDILRLAHNWSVDSLFVARRLASSVADLRAGADSARYHGEVVCFGGHSLGAVAHSYELEEGAIRLSLSPSFRADIVDHLATEMFESSPLEAEAVLIVGRRWSPSAHDWIQLYRAGYDRIVCAEFEQPIMSSWPDLELEPDAIPPDFVTDLSRSGPFRISLSF
jgi:ComEC/Rec2-related protein